MDRGLEGAEAAYRRGDERDDEDSAYNLGRLLERRGDLEGAEAAYRRGDEGLDGESAYSLGRLLERRGDLEGAEAAYERAKASRDPEAPERAQAALNALRPNG